MSTQTQEPNETQKKEPTKTQAQEPAQEQAPAERKPAPAAPSTFDREVRSSYKALMTYLHSLARRRVPPSQVDDIVSRTFVRALEQECAGNHWDPAVEPLRWRLADIQFGVLRDWRRTLERKPTSPWLDTDDPASDAPLPDEAIAGWLDDAELEACSAEVRRRLLEQTLTGLSVAVFDAAREGIAKSKHLLEKLGCSQEELKLARDRIRYQADRVAERYKKKRGKP